VRYYNAWIEVTIYYIKTIVSHLDVLRQNPKKSRELKISRNWRRVFPFVHTCLLQPNTHIVRYYNAWIEVMIYYAYVEEWSSPSTKFQKRVEKRK